MSRSLSRWLPKLIIDATEYSFTVRLTLGAPNEAFVSLAILVYHNRVWILRHQTRTAFIVGVLFSHITHLCEQFSFGLISSCLCEFAEPCEHSTIRDVSLQLNTLGQVVGIGNCVLSFAHLDQGLFAVDEVLSRSTLSRHTSRLTAVSPIL